MARTRKNTKKKERRHPLRQTRPSPFLPKRRSGRGRVPAEPPVPKVRPVTVPQLTGKERKQLRGMAHHMRPVVIVGANGITKSVVHAVDEALTARELIKVRFHDPEDKKAMAEDLARRVGAALVGLIGHTAILYRPNEED